MSDTLHTLYLLIRKTTQAEEVREHRDKTKGCKLESYVIPAKAFGATGS